MRVTVIATGFEQKASAAPAKTESGVAAPKMDTAGDIDEIFNIFKR